MINRTFSRAWIAISAAALTACGSIEPARMALPEPLRQAAPITIEGIAAGQSGSFRAGEYRGRYARSATRLEIFGDLAVVDRGRASYTVDGLAPEPLSARCTVRQTTMTIGIVGFEPQAFAYECDFDRLGRPAGVRFTLQAGQGAAATMRAERRGRIDYRDTTLALRSVHAVEGSPLPLGTPIGYVFEREGRPVGAVELNGMTPRLWLPPADDDSRRAAVAAAMALAVFWDPAQRP
jgi:hypothetical protein